MTTHELTDPTGSALTITHNRDGVWLTATEDRDEVTVGPFPTHMLAEAVTAHSTPAPLRHSIDPADTDGGVTAALIEEEADHPTPERARSLVQELDEAVERAEQAERELVEARQIIDARMTGGRGITAGDITDEMVERGRGVLAKFGYHPLTGTVRRVLNAALAEPPARDPRAEALHEAITDFDTSQDGETDTWDLAEWLVSLGWTKEGA